MPVRSLSEETAWQGSESGKAPSDNTIHTLLSEHCQGSNMSGHLRLGHLRLGHLRLGHLIIRDIAGCFVCVSIQEKLKHTDVGEDSSMEESRTTHSPLLQLRTLLEQQAKHTKCKC